jgi:hypothetical protein
MQASILVALAIVIGVDTAAHAGCTTSLSAALSTTRSFARDAISQCVE